MKQLNLNFDANTLKLMAIVAMFFDHFVAVFVLHDSLAGIYLRFPGRISAPIISYFIAEGYYYTSNRKRYLTRLFVFALVSHLPYNLLFGYGFFEATSVIWGLAMGLIALMAVKEERFHPLLKLAIVALCAWFSIRANWNFVVVFWIVGFGIFRGNVNKQIWSFIGVGVVFHLIPTMIRFGLNHEAYPHWYQFGFVLAIPLLLSYNGLKGNVSKWSGWFFYIFYPGHLFLLYLIDQFTPLAAMLGV